MRIHRAGNEKAGGMSCVASCWVTHAPPVTRSVRLRGIALWSFASSPLPGGWSWCRPRWDSGIIHISSTLRRISWNQWRSTIVRLATVMSQEHSLIVMNHIVEGYERSVLRVRSLTEIVVVQVEQLAP